MPEADQLRKRHIAYKLRVCDVLNSSYVKSGNFPNYIDFGGKEVSRVNIIGVVVGKSDSENRSIVIDDGTGRISARVFEKNLSFERVNVGDFVLIIGRPREFQAEKYVLIEIIKRIDDLWAKARKIEMDSIDYKKPESDSENENYISDDGIKDKVVRAIKELDKGDGVSVEEVFSISNNNDKIIDALLKEGDIFEVKPGKLKVLE